MNDTQATLLTLLNSYGDIVELDWDFDVDNIITQLSSNNNWVTGPSVSAPMGLSLTGSDTLDLRVKDRKEGEYNNNLKSCPSLVEFFDVPSYNTFRMSPAALIILRPCDRYWKRIFLSKKLLDGL